jgi:competence protein ComEA
MKENNKSKYIIAIAVAIGLILFNKFINDKSDNLVVEKSNTIEEISNKNPKAEMIDDIKKVHISGEILNQGVYEIKDGDRLEDLVQKAGGLTEEADLDKINLSMKLEDQMRIIIPNINQPENNLVDQNKTEYITNNDATININTASKEELMTLPNIGEKRAESIINYRESNRFENIEDIMKVDGIGEKYFDQMRDMIRTN